MVLEDDRLEQRPIRDVVRKRQRAFVVGFDPESFRVGYHEITGWYEGPVDRIYEVELASGRRVRVTAGHNLFTIDTDGLLTKVRTAELQPGTKVAVPRRIPEVAQSAPTIDVLRLIPEAEYPRLVCEGPTVADAFADRGELVRAALRAAGYRHFDYYRARLGCRCTSHGRCRGWPNRSAPAIESTPRRPLGACTLDPVDADFAWFLGMYVAEGYRRKQQFVVSNTDQPRLDRIEATLRKLGLPVYRVAGSITCCSSFASSVLEWLGTGGRAGDAFLAGLRMAERPRRVVPPRPRRRRRKHRRAPHVDLDDIRRPRRRPARPVQPARSPRRHVLRDRGHHRSVRCTSRSRAQAAHLGSAAGSPPRRRPQPSRTHASGREPRAGYRHATDLNNIERRRGRDAVRTRTLRRLRDAYVAAEGSDEFRRSTGCRGRSDVGRGRRRDRHPHGGTDLRHRGAARGRHIEIRGRSRRRARLAIPPGSSMQGGTGTSRSSCRTSPTSRSRCTRA